MKYAHTLTNDDVMMMEQRKKKKKKKKGAIKSKSLTIHIV